MDGCVFANVYIGLYAAFPVLIIGGLGLVVFVEGAILWTLDRSLTPTDAALAAAGANTVSTLAGAGLASMASGVPVLLGLVAAYALSVIIEVLTLWPFWNTPRMRLCVPVAAGNLASYALLAAIVYSLHGYA